MTPARFGDHALRLSGAAIRLTGWTPDAFWAATPAELAAILAPDASDPPDPAMTRPLTRAELADLMEPEHDR